RADRQPHAGAATLGPATALPSTKLALRGTAPRLACGLCRDARHCRASLRPRSLVGVGGTTTWSTWSGVKARALATSPCSIQYESSCVEVASSTRVAGNDPSA